ncbi:hypothetical protein ACROSR_01290 [Roseovarius tibetensis]|uniref:hypothetical protein n=1 Tax=Roseovarius tibetensis TaxID=2685897 RepID=UPI003D7FD03D
MTDKKTDQESIETTDPSTGRGSTADPHQADLNDVEPWPDTDADVPETPDAVEIGTPDPDAVPGTTKDPNQADRT